MVQAIFVVLYLLLYVCSSKTAHRFVGYLEEEAVVSYTHYLKELDEGRIENVPAPQIAKQYWGFASNIQLRDVLLVVREDEVEHCDVNHQLADKLVNDRTLLTQFKPEYIDHANNTETQNQ